MASYYVFTHPRYDVGCYPCDKIELDMRDDTRKRHQ